MTEDNAVAVATTTPWYKSKILQGILVSGALGILSHTKFAALFTQDDVTQFVNWLLEGAAVFSLWYAGHARVTTVVHPIAGTKTADAVSANAASTAPTLPAPTLAAILAEVAEELKASRQAREDSQKKS